MTPELLNTNDAAALLGFARQTLALWRLKGSGPRYIKLGRRVLYSMDDISAWLNANYRTSTSDRGEHAA